MDDEFELDAPQYAPASRNQWPSERVAVATIEEIRYAETLRLQIRESYLGRCGPAPSVWTTGVD
jgi:hypothetical protein